jgi:hypothetical protein
MFPLAEEEKGKHQLRKPAFWPRFELGIPGIQMRNLNASAILALCRIFCLVFNDRRYLQYLSEHLWKPKTDLRLSNVTKDSLFQAMSPHVPSPGTWRIVYLIDMNWWIVAKLSQQLCWLNTRRMTQELRELRLSPG